MAKITPTISFTTNAYNATSNAGPGSITLAAAISDTLNVDYQEALLIETSNVLNANANGANGPLDGSGYAGGDGDSGLTPGTVGSFVFFKNNSTTTGENIYISIATAGGNQASAVPAATGAGGTALEEADHETLRTMTLLPGEFAWFPWDYTGDIHYVAATGTPELEYWRWDRST
tara:strand:+ start:633 stop:1157 length:525 start_codon:yes stop_codon:yes gene_type:complete